MYKHTLFNTPLVSHLFYALSWLWLRAAGWKIRGTPPDESRFVIIAYPHTSNWDVPLTIAICMLYRLRIYWLGKASLFKGPLGPVIKWLGGVPVDPQGALNQVQQIIETFEQADEFILVISPEGNRSYVERWRTGFYRIAAGAKVPICLGFLDFSKKEGGYLESYFPSGDIEKDVASIQAEYAGIQGKYPDQSRLY